MSRAPEQNIQPPLESARELRLYFDRLLATEASLDILSSGPAPRGGAGNSNHPERAGLASFALAVEGLTELALIKDVDHVVFKTVAASLVEAGHVSPEELDLDLCLWSLHHSRLVSFPPHVAVQALLRLARGGAPFEELSLWRRGPDGPECVARVGEGRPSAALADTASRALAADGAAPDGLLHAEPIMRWRELHAVLVGRAAGPGLQARCRAVLAAAAAAVQPALEKDLLLRRSSEREQALVESTERRVIRLGLDLHDGPLQDLAVLADEVRLLRRQLGQALEGSEHQEILVGRTDDVEARLIALDEELRELARSFEAPSFANRPLRDVLEREVTMFRRRADMGAALEVRGDLSTLTASQRIAIVRIVQESLANAREHSGATEVKVSVVSRPGVVRASVTDNGRGFDVEPSLVHAAGQGRLGLVGMSERIRLLGGAFDVQSSPGGPTTVSVALPEWHPLRGSPAAEGEERGA
ncbi:MAG TPA: ATP-binding protein [Gaiellaceae bacterium]|nr:ATP-binding protein [Gaiellaceae bacterium]